MDEALRMASLYPAKVLSMDHNYGMIQKGYNASFIMLDKEFNIINAERVLS
jgi:N-acetylglucosamine-6-phosphate deacetylase